MVSRITKNTEWITALDSKATGRGWCLEARIVALVTEASDTGQIGGRERVQRRSWYLSMGQIFTLLRERLLGNARSERKLCVLVVRQPQSS